MLRVGKHADDAVIGGAFGGELEIAGQGEPRRLAGFDGGLHVGGEGGEFDEVADTQDGRADGEDAAVDHDVAMADELSSRGDAAREAETEDDVVEPSFEQADEAFDPVGLLEGAGVADEPAKLLFAEAVMEEELLFFAKL